MLHPSKNFRQDIAHDKDDNECNNQECNSFLKAINFLRAYGFLGKAKNQTSSFKDEIKQIIIGDKSDAANANKMAESVLVFNSKLLNKIIDRVDELDA